MRPRFPGMDPWLERPALWPGVHNSLIVAIADDLGSKVAPRYFVGVEQHSYLTWLPGELAAIGTDGPIGRSRSGERMAGRERHGAGDSGVIEMDVEVPVQIPVEEWYLEIRTAEDRKRVTVIEILSPTTRLAGAGRRKYLRWRRHILGTRASLVEIDLIRGGRPMPMWAPVPVETPYRILIARGASRPRAKLLAFGIRQAIPTIPIPLLPGDPEPTLDLGAVLHALYDRAHFDLQLDYKKPPVPPLDSDDAAWARDILAS